MTLLPNPLVIPVGILIGILVSAPVGPVNVLCIQRAIERGFFGGVAAGLGAVLGDGLIALFAAFGVKADTLLRMQTAYDLAQARKHEAKIRVKPLKNEAA